jgi:quercetin dioxygenase-like cupin family protein
MRLRSLVLLAGTCLLLASTADAQELARPNLVLQEKVKGMPMGETQEVRVLTATIPPGSKTPFHTHRYPVTVYILEGAFTLEVEGQQARMVKAGESMVEPPNTKMTGLNRGDVPMKVVIFYVSDPDTPFLDPVTQ